MDEALKKMCLMSVTECSPPRHEIESTHNFVARGPSLVIKTSNKKGETAIGLPLLFCA